MKVNLYKLEKVINGESNETYKKFIEDISAKEYTLSGRHSIEGVIGSCQASCPIFLKL